MIELVPPDSHHLRAAQGWLELGNPREALVELDRLGTVARAHPESLQTEWEIHAEQKHWERAAIIGQQAITLAPEIPAGWLNRSFALHELRRTREAWDQLLPAAKRFPKEPTIAYNLACYACQLGELDQSRDWLMRALQIGPDPKRIKSMALEDVDLALLRSEISEM